VKNISCVFNAGSGDAANVDNCLTGLQSWSISDRCSRLQWILFTFNISFNLTIH